MEFELLRQASVYRLRSCESNSTAPGYRPLGQEANASMNALGLNASCHSSTSAEANESDEQAPTSNERTAVEASQRVLSSSRGKDIGKRAFRRSKPTFSTSTPPRSNRRTAGR